MFFSFGMKSGLETLIALSKPYAPSGQIQNIDELKSAYLEFLRHYQPDVPAPFSGTPVFVTDESLIEHLAGFFRVKSWLNDKNQGRMIEGVSEDGLQRMRALEAGFADLERVFPELAAFFKLAINYVFCASSKSAGGGTTSSALGVIWAAHRDSWNSTDVLEFFVHELTHNMVFLDECRFGHYPDYPALSAKENFARSAILSMERPLDKVIHSLMVATEILMFREYVTGHPQHPNLHPRSEVLVAKATGCIRSIESLPNLDGLTTVRTRELIERSKRLLLTIWKQSLVNNYETTTLKSDFESVPMAF